MVFVSVDGDRNQHDKDGGDLHGLLGLTEVIISSFMATPRKKEGKMRSIFFYRMPCFAEQRSYDSFATITFWSLPRLHASDGCIQSFGSKSTWFLPGTTVLVLAAQVPQQSFCF